MKSSIFRISGIIERSCWGPDHCHAAEEGNNKVKAGREQDPADTQHLFAARQAQEIKCVSHVQQNYKNKQLEKVETIFWLLSYGSVAFLLQGGLTLVVYNRYTQRAVVIFLFLRGSTSARLSTLCTTENWNDWFLTGEFCELWSCSTRFFLHILLWYLWVVIRSLLSSMRLNMLKMWELCAFASNSFINPRDYNGILWRLGS